MRTPFLGLSTHIMLQDKKCYIPNDGSYDADLAAVAGGIVVLAKQDQNDDEQKDGTIDMLK